VRINIDTKSQLEEMLTCTCIISVIILVHITGLNGKQLIYLIARAHKKTVAFAVDQLKIDRSFIGRLGGETADTAMVAAICELGRALGLEVVAEGVEDAVQRSALLALDCRLAQGYWISRPVVADAFEAVTTAVEARLG
jgi:hypothetical protein